MDSLISRFDQALNGQKKSVFVFDIDSTIFNVSPRNQAIFDLFCSIHKKQHPFLHKLSSSLRLNHEDWGLDRYIDMLDKHPELKKEASLFWRKHFFAGTFLHSDQPYPKAIELIQFLHQQKSKILYLTGRDHHRMREGSLLQLKHWHSPLDKDSDLITKPHKGMKDGAYKESELSQILEAHQDQEVFFLDNEPSVLKHCLFTDKKNYTPVFIKSTHSKRSEPQESWVKLDAHFYEEFLKQIRGNQK